MEAAIHKRNLESSILFMQQEHANTLKALHEEIQKLQKKCSDLTFQLNMAGLDLGKTEDPATKEHIKHLETMVDNQRETQHEFEVELDKKDKLIKENEYNYKRQKMKYLEEMRMKNQEIEDYKAKLESASNNVAYLTNELLKYKKMLHSASNQPDHGQSDSAYAPAPPKEARSHPRRSTLHIRRSLNEPVAPDLNPVRKSSGGSNRSESPAELVKPFLRNEIENEADIHIKQTNPLPPIRTSSGRVVFNDQVDVAVVSMRAPSNSKSIVKKDVKKSSTQEVETLAVGHLSHSTSAWGKRTQESKSSEYH